MNQQTLQPKNLNKELPYHCNICGKGYSQIAWVSKHQAKEHPAAKCGSDQSAWTNIPLYDSSEMGELWAQKIGLEAATTDIIELANPSQDDQIYEHAGRIYPLDANDSDEVGYLRENKTVHGFEPFLNEKSYNLAEWLTRTNTPKKEINLLFAKDKKYPIDSSTLDSLKSAHSLRIITLNMPDTLGIEAWGFYDTGLHWSKKDELKRKKTIHYYRRDFLDVAKWLLRQRCYAPHMTYAPIKRTHKTSDGKETRVYSEMHTANWWWDEQDRLPRGATIMPIIMMSDATHLTNFSGDQSAWPIYMTIGNINSDVRCKPSFRTTQLIALLPEPPKKQKMNACEKTEYVVAKHKMLHTVLGDIFEPLFDDELLNFRAVCADGNVRKIFPRVAGWLADYPEHIMLQGLESGSCFWCEVPKDQLGDWQNPRKEIKVPNPNLHLWKNIETATVTIGKPHRKRDGDKYEGHFNLKKYDELIKVGVKPQKNVLRGLNINIADLPKPDLLHTLLLGMVEHIMKWLITFLSKYHRLDEFNAAWTNVPSFLDMTGPRKTYEQVKQWSGKDMRKLVRFLVPVLHIALRARVDHLGNRLDTKTSLLFNNVLQCIRHFIDFHMYAHYDQHDEGTLELMDEALKDFHDTKRVFLQFRAGKKAHKDAQDVIKEIEQEKTADLAQKMSPEERAERKKYWQDNIDKLKMDAKKEVLEGDAHFNLPKLHNCSHFSESVELFGALKQYSTDTSEKSHIEILKKAFKCTNKCGDVKKQMLEYTCRRKAFVMRDLNNNVLRQVSKKLEDDSVRPQSILGGIQRKKIPALGKSIKDFRTLCQLIHDDDGFRSQLHTYISAHKYLPHLELSELEDLPTSLYHKLDVYVQHFQSGIWEKQSIRCTLSTLWMGIDVRQDWVWWKVPEDHLRRRNVVNPKAMYGWLHGRLPFRLNCLFRVRIPGCSRGRLETLNLAFGQLTEPQNGGKPDQDSSVVRVKHKMYTVIDVKDIDGAAHLIPENKGTWVVNNYIDLQTWNSVCFTGDKFIRPQKCHT